MTTASRLAIHSLATYRRNAATTIAVTVMPSPLAFSTAASHRSVGMRSDLGMVAMSGRACDLGSLVGEQCGASLGALAGSRTLDHRHVAECLLGAARAVPAPRVPRALVCSERVGDLVLVHFDSSSRRVSTVCTRMYLHVNPSAQLSLERAA